MVRMYVAKRPLDIMTVSINHPDEKKFAQNFLRNGTRSAAISSSVETILPMP
jgi:hypothetical protein